MDINLIKRHADDYFNRVIFDVTDCEKFISYVKRNATRYDRTLDKRVFIERIAFQLKIKYDRHLLFCKLHETCACRFVKFFEAVLFYLQYELRKLENVLSRSESKSLEKQGLNSTLKVIVDRINSTEIGNKLDYQGFMREMEELKSYYYLNKKIWTQLLVGKLTDMLGQKIVNKSICKEILSAVDNIYPELLVNPHESKEG